MQQKISITGKSPSLLQNYGRHLAKLALHFGCVPTDLDLDQINILPKGLVRIRHYGILSSTCKKETIPRIKDQLPEQSLIRAEYPQGESYNPKVCPHCRTETMVSLEILPKRGPPAHARLMETARLMKK
jgi:hypothetical protein